MTKAECEVINVKNTTGTRILDNGGDTFTESEDEGGDDLGDDEEIIALPGMTFAL